MAVAEALDMQKRPPLTNDSIRILAPQDAIEALRGIEHRVQVVMLDPWYNRGAGGVVEGYSEWLHVLLAESGRVGDHVFLWGFPDIICKVLDDLPPPLELVAWLTWYYKNCPSVIRGWRSAQLACLHLSVPGAPIYPEHFLNDKQLDLKKRGKLRYMPGPPSVIECALLVGFVGRKEQTGHPAQKPEKVFEPLIQMTTVEGDTVLDPMCGAGTTGAVCRNLNRRAILCDASEEYTTLAESRLGIQRATEGA